MLIVKLFSSALEVFTTVRVSTSILEAASPNVIVWAPSEVKVKFLTSSSAPAAIPICPWALAVATRFAAFIVLIALSVMVNSPPVMFT